MRKLFRENFRRLAPAGLLLTLLFGALSVILSINRQPDVINIEEISFILYAFPYIGGVVLSLTGFSFLHSRAASDLYLGLPYRRRTLYTGVVLGILAWGGLILGLSLGLTWLCLSLRGCLFLRIHLLVLFVYWFIAFVLVAGAFILGQCFSGTRFFGFSWGMLVLCLPRYILGLLAFYIAQTVGSVAGDFTSIWLQPRWNLATGPLMSFLKAVILSIFMRCGSIYTACCWGRPRWLWEPVLFKSGGQSFPAPPPSHRQSSTFAVRWWLLCPPLPG